jgi:hypothetical protein
MSRAIDLWRIKFLHWSEPLPISSPKYSTLMLKPMFHTLLLRMLSQPIREGRWANWLVKLEEFDIEVRSLKEVKGKGPRKLITRIDAVNLSSQANISIQDYQSDWYKELVTCFQSG